MKKLIAIFITLIFLIQIFLIIDAYGKETNIENTLLNSKSVRNIIEDIVVIPSKNPLFGIIGSYVSCWYNSEEYGLKPMIIHRHMELMICVEMF